MVHELTIQDFLALSREFTVIDVRSEKEFLDGHIPGAINIPILNDEERKIVGTTYKYNGRQPAVYKGLELSGPHLSERLRKGVKYARNGKVLVHCWRGGMRSEFFAFLIHYYGLEPFLLKGGYKTYRQAAHEAFQMPLKIRILAGRTGTGKTEILKELRDSGEQVIDLEGLAKHRGSSFGALGYEEKPSQEQFENDLFHVLRELDSEKHIWIEDENRTIGDKVIPERIWKQMLDAPRFFVDRTFDERLDQIMADYSVFPLEKLKIAMARIGKRLGPQHVKRALEYLDSGELREAFSIALSYYDKAYNFQLSGVEEERMITIDGTGKSFWEIAAELKEVEYGK